MYCLYCGSAIPEEASFCEACGRQQRVTRIPSSPPDSLDATEAATLKNNLKFAWLTVLLSVLVLTAVLLLAFLNRPVSSTSREQHRSAEPEPAVNRTEAKRSEVAPPKYRVYKSILDLGTSYVVPVRTTDAQLASLLWFFREKVKAGAFAEIGITQPTSRNWGVDNYKSGILMIYRGEKCANEGFVSDAQLAQGYLGACGGGDHSDAIYQWGFPPWNKEGFCDSGSIGPTVVFQDKGEP